MKIGLISHKSELGGAELCLLETIDALKVSGHDCFVILPTKGDIELELQKREISYRIIPYRLWVSANRSIPKKIARFLINRFAASKVATQIKKWHCEVLITNTMTIVTGALAAHYVGIPHIWHIHEFGYEDHGYRFDWGENRSYALMNKYTERFIVNSEATYQKYARHLPANKIDLIYLSVQMKSMAASELPESLKNIFSDKSDLKCIMVGSLHARKRQEHAIEAVRILKDKGFKIELVMVGSHENEYAHSMQNLVNEYHLDQSIQFIETVKNPFPVMKQADVLLMCSRSEAFGRVTVEAMYTGIPVIGANSGGTSELIKPDFNGLLYNSTVEDLAEKMLYLVNHRDEIKKMGENAAEWSKKMFTEDKYRNKLSDILNKIKKSNSTD